MRTTLVKWPMAIVLCIVSSVSAISTSSHRTLEVGDFAALNEIVSKALIYLGDTSVGEGMILNLSITNLRCTNFAVGDMSVQSFRRTDQTVALLFDVVNLSMDCFMDYHYQTIFLVTGSGRSSVQANSTASATAILQSTNFDQDPPTTSFLESCSATIGLANLQFLDGGILALAPVESLLTRLVESQAESTVCQKLRDLSTTTIVNLLVDAKNTLDEYPADLPVDPLTSERELVVPVNTKILNLMEKETEVGKLLDLSLKELVKFLSKEVPDDAGTTDLKANILLRELLLVDRALLLNVTDFPFVTDGVLWQNEDKLTDTTITLNSIKLLGLDTMTALKPLETVGNYTVQNELSWEYLTFELDATIDIKPSRAPDSVIVDPGPTNVIENITIKVGFENLDAMASFLLAIDQDLLERIQLGSLLNWDGVVPCIVSTLFDLEIPSLTVSLSNVQEPTLEGFVSPGIDRIVTDAALAAFRSYESVLLRSAPAFFQIAVRTAINNVIQEELQNIQAGGRNCTNINTESSQGDFVDFRDLFLEPVAAASAGSSGTEPYGDVMSSIYTEFSNRFIVTGNDGLPKLNSAIRTATKAQSGVEGQFRMTEPFGLVMQNVTSLTSLVSQVEMIAKSRLIANLDTVVLPLKLLDLINAHELANSIDLGQILGRPLSLSTDLLFQIDGDNSPLSVSNLFELTVTLQSAIRADLLATLRTEQFLEFPLRDLTNPWCWLAAIPALEVDEIGDQLNQSAQTGLQFTELGLFTADLDFDIKCISCSSYGGEALPEVVSALKDSGAVLVVEERLRPLWSELAKTYWESLEIENRITESRSKCPSSGGYNAEVDTSFEWPGFPPLSRHAIESMVMFSTLAINFGMVLTAKSHLLRPVNATDPLSGQTVMQNLTTGELIDWYDPGASLGEWATSIVDEAHAYLCDKTEDKESGKVELQMNILARRLLNNGTFAVALNDTNLGVAAMKAKLSALRITGLDSVRKIDVLNVIGPQTFSNRLKFRELRLELDVDFDHESAVERATLKTSLNGVDVNMAFLLAVDWRKLGSMKVGSILHLKKILPCMVSKFYALNVTQLLVHADSVGEPRVHGFLSKNASDALAETSRRFLNSSSDDLVSAIPKVSDMTIREVLNHIFLEILTSEDSYCTFETLPTYNRGEIDFRDMFLPENEAMALGGTGDSPYGDTFRLLYQTFLNQLAAASEKNQTALNNYIRHVTYEQSNVNGSFLFPGELFNTSGTATIGNWIFAMEGRLSNVRIENVDTIGQPLHLLQPVLGQASVLNNSISFGVGPNPLQLAGTLYLALTDDNEMDIRNEVNVTLDIHAMTVVGTVLLAMSESSFFALSLEHLQDINCWLSTIPAESLDADMNISSWFRYDISAEKAALNISCVTCGSPLFGQLVEKLYNPGDTEEDIRSFVHVAKDLTDSFLGSDFLRTITRSAVADAAKLCPASPQYDANATTGEFWLQPQNYMGLEGASRDTKMRWFNVANAVIAVVFVVSAMTARWLIRRKNREWLRSLTDDKIAIVRRQDEIEVEKENYLNTHTESMFRSEQIPRRVRYAVPVVILVNIAMYLVAHIALLFYINIEAQIAGDYFTVEHFLDFTFFGAALRTYRNGGNEMAIFLIFFSGIWPYLKLLSALYIWFVKPSRVPVARREKLLLWMDALTKLSIVDLVTMLIAIAALLVYIGGPGDELYDSQDLYASTLIVVPQVGFYCILIAQRLNRANSRFFLDYHNKIVLVASEEFKRIYRMPIANQWGIVASDSTAYTSESTKASSSFPREISLIGEDSTDTGLTSPSITPTKTTIAVSSQAHSSLSFEENSDVCLESPPRLYVTNNAGDFLLYDPNDTFYEEPLHDEVALVESPIEQSTWIGRMRRYVMCKCFQGRHVMGGTVSVALAGVFVFILFIIGCAMAPSLSVDAKEVLSVALESGRTYADAVNDFNVFRVVSLVLLKTRFVLSSTADYVGLGILLSLAGLSMVAFPAMQGWKRLRAWYNSRKEVRTEPPEPKHMPVIPGFTNRLKVWNHMEIFVISFCIASWQLGAVFSYLLQNYCDMLHQLYDALGYVGLVEQTSSNCFSIQASDPFTLLMLIGSFIVLFTSFIIQAHDQYKKNVQHLEELLDNAPDGHSTGLKRRSSLGIVMDVPAQDDLASRVCDDVCAFLH